MKKILLVLTVLIMVAVVLMSCQKTTDTIGGGYAEKEVQAVSVDGLDIKILGCNFSEEISGRDKEYIGSYFPDRKKDIYIDLVLFIKNNKEVDFTGEDISGYIMYDDARNDMQVGIESLSSTGINDFINPKELVIAPKSFGVVHLFTVIDEPAKNESIVVNYKINGKDFECEVLPEDNRGALERKTEVFVGDKVDVNGLYEFEVISCKNTKIMKAQNLENTEQYQHYGKETFFELVLKVKNKTASDLEEIRCYTEVDGELLRATSAIETNNNTDIDKWGDAPLAAGEEEYYHIYTSLEEGTETDGLIMRFNLGGNCYYCEIEE